MIKFWNRKEAREEVEQVYGDVFIRWIYGTRPGQILANAVLSKPPLSQVYGAYQSSRLSRHKIEPFIQDFKIPMQEFEEGPFASFNDFFIRKFKHGARPFAQGAEEMPAFAEARYFAYESVPSSQRVPVKGVSLSVSALLGSSEKAKPFEGGPVLLARLCPTDYHRFHYPDSGKIRESYCLQGGLHSVNPMALKYKSDIFLTNERHVSILSTDHFGLLAYIEVGALCVGKIVQTHPSTGLSGSTSPSFERGDEKGYFLFGGSTVIVLGQPGVWRPDADLLEQTLRGQECLVRLGERVAIRF